MKKIKQRAEETDNVMGKIKADKMAELDKLRIDTEMEEVRARLEENRAKIRESQRVGQALAPQQAYNFAELLFAGRPPEEIKQIIDSLDETALDKLAYLATTMNGQQLGAFTQTLRRPETNVKDTIELVNTIVKMNQRPPEQQGITLQGIAALMKEVREAQTPQQPQQAQDPMQVYKVVAEIVRPFQEEARAREKEANELRLREVESKIINPADYIKNIKTMASDLGLTGGGKSEFDLKLEEMKQNRETDNRKIDLEEKKYFYEKDHEGDTVETVKEIIKTVSEGPIGKAIENIGGGAADRLRAGKGNSTPLVKAQCPQCHGQFMVNPALPTVQCNHCGAMLSAQQNPNVPPPATPQPQPEPTPQPESQAQPQPQAETPKPEPTPQVTSETQPQNVEETQQPPSPEAKPQEQQPSIVTNIIDLNKS